MNIPARIKKLLTLASGLLALSQPVDAAEVAGVKLDDTVRLANADLKLNGAGVRFKSVFKVYVAGLYLTEKKASVPELLATSGPKRMSLVLLRDVGANQFGQSFMDGISHNSSKSDTAKMIDQMIKFGEMFSKVLEFKKGDVILMDWLPGTGTVVSVNGKKMAEPFPDVAFYNALMRIWLGERPADATLKRQLLGEKIEIAPSSKKEL